MYDHITIPIFITNLVLFPRQSLTISINNLHDKQMIYDCMLDQKQFGICLIDNNKTIFGLPKPKLIGTIAKIQNCTDVDRLGMQLHVDLIGRRKFKIISLISPDIELNDTQRGKTLNLDTNTYNKKLYLTAHVQTFNDIEDKISLNTWENLILMWKNKLLSNNNNEDINNLYFDRLLKNYDLFTDTPTIDYIYSLSALGSSTPNDLQIILESLTIDDLLSNVKKLFKSKFN